jgi:outer membrane immunogenic protein
MRGLRLLLSTSALICVSYSASAADLGPMRPYAPLTARPIAIAPTWTGWYLGGNLGYSWGSARSDVNFPGLSVDSGVPAGTIDTPGFASHKSTNLDGFLGGAQFGYNWQLSPAWLVGFETDFQRAGQKGTTRDSNDFASTVLLPDAGAGLGDCPCDVTGSSGLSYETEMRWFGTVRGRLGVIWDSMMFYGTGGLAYGRFDVNGRSSRSVEVTDDLSATVFTDSSTSSFSKSQWKAGWTIGAGVEGKAWDPRWTWKAEYLYLDFGTLETQVGAAGGGKTTISSKITDHVGRVGLNYRF